MKTVGLIQAHHASWEGALDFSLASVEGKRAIVHTIDRLRSMPEIDAIVLAVPDVPENSIFKDIANAEGVSCFFGSKENVLDRCRGAIDLVQGEIVVHVMGQHCFIDTTLLGEMVRTMQERKLIYLSMPDSFTPYFAGKVYTRAMLDTVDDVLHTLEESAIHYARFAAFVESNREKFTAGVFTKLPVYSKEYLLHVRTALQEMFSDDRLHVVPENASTVSSPLLESYDFAKKYLRPTDHVLDIACGDGFGCRRICASVAQINGVDINAELIADNNRSKTEENIIYDIGDACALSYTDASFDAVTAMEIIEHIPLEQVETFLSEVRRVLKPGGVFLCSTPQNSMGDIPVVPWHVKEYSLEEFKSLLGEHFAEIKVYAAKSGGPLTEDEYGQKMLSICR